MKAICDILGVARSNLQVRARRPSTWRDQRRDRRPRNDAELVAEITREVTALPSYGYRRAWTMVNRRRDAEGRRRVNHKRVYRVMHDYRLLLHRHTADHSTHAAMMGTLRWRKATAVGAQIASRSPATIASGYESRLHSIAVIAKR